MIILRSSATLGRVPRSGRVRSGRGPRLGWAEAGSVSSEDILGLGDREVRAQCNGIITITGVDGDSMHIYTGDLWTSAPDSLKSHDIQYWSPPLEFDDAQDVPTIRPMKFVQNFTISV